MSPELENKSRKIVHMEDRRTEGQPKGKVIKAI
jgi:hypothetical protein